MINCLYDFYKNKTELYSKNMLFDNKMTYAQGLVLAEQRAAFLQKEGYKKGDVIAILAVSNAEWIITYMAVNIIGGIVLPLDVNLPHEQYPEMIKKMKTKALFISEDFKGVVKRVKTFNVSLDGAIEKKKKIKAPEVSPDDIATYLFTSGTTGKPKIVMLTHKNIYSTAESTAVVSYMSEKDVILCILPLYHVYALDACFIGPYAKGASFIYQTSLKGPDIMKSMAENPITIFPAAPLLWEMFMDGIINKVKKESAAKHRLFTFFLEYGIPMRKLGLSFLVDKIFDPIHDVFGRSHRFFISGGAPLKDRYRKYYRSMGFTLIEGYGLSETTGPITLPDPDNNIIGSVGQATPGNEAKIKNINEDGIGEVWLRGDSVMPGYYQNDEANKEVFDDEGFFNTGDLGKMDKKKNIFLTGRVKNVIVLPSGKNVYPEELESYYKQSLEIEEIAVFGMKRDNSEKVYSVIVPANKSELSFGIIKSELARLNKGLPSYKTVTDFAISLDPLPVNSARKVMYNHIKNFLKEGIYMENEDDSAVLKTPIAGQSPAEDIIVEALHRNLKTETIFAKQSLSDFGIDSLGLVDLIVNLEHELNIFIDPVRLKDCQTMEELLQYLSALEKTDGGTLNSHIFDGEITEKPQKIFNPILYPWIGIMKLFLKFFWRVTVKNKEKLNIDNCIMVANHTSFLDLMFFASALSIKDIKNSYAIGKKKVSKIKFIFPGVPVIWVDYDKNTNEVFKKSSDLLRQGKSILIFPEGTRTRDGEINEFKQGAAYLAKNINRKIIPVTINGAYKMWPAGKKCPRFIPGMKGNLVIGDPIDPSKFDSVESLNMKIFSEIKKNLE